MTTKKFWLTILSGLAVLILIGGFLLYDYKLALLLVICGGFSAIIIYVVLVLVKINRELFDRNTYLTDVIMKVDPVIAHNINQVPPVMQQEPANEGIMDIAGMENVPFQFVKR